MSNYQDVRKQISLYFDNELGSEEKNQLLSIVDNDPKCSTLFKKEQTFREFIKNNISRPSVSSDLIKNIKNKISTVA
jgi:F0F1-type ATP synthase delta subunit